MEEVNKNTEKSTESGIEKRKKNLKLWKKGDPSPNPKGKPKGQRDYATIYRAALIKLGQQNNKTPDELEEEMLANGALLARKGDYRFYKDVLDRTHGQATSKVEHSGEITISSILDDIEKQNGNNG